MILRYIFLNACSKGCQIHRKWVGLAIEMLNLGIYGLMVICPVVCYRRDSLDCCLLFHSSAGDTYVQTKTRIHQFFRNIANCFVRDQFPWKDSVKLSHYGLWKPIVFPDCVLNRAVILYECRHSMPNFTVKLIHLETETNCFDLLLYLMCC